MEDFERTEDDHMVSHQSKNRKKKKNTFDKLAKYYRKHDQFGLGHQVSTVTYDFFIEAYKIVKGSSGFDKELAIQRIFNQFDDGDKLMACNQYVSHLLNEIIPLADISSLLKLCNQLSDDLHTFTADQFSSHVVQNTLLVSLKLLQENASEFYHTPEKEIEERLISEENKDALKNYVIKIAKFSTNNLATFFTDTYASHVLRSLLQVLSGVAVQATHKAKTQHQLLFPPEETKLAVPPEFSELLVAFVARLKKISDISDKITTECGSALLQCTLKVLHSNKPKLCRKFVKFLLKDVLASFSTEEEGPMAIYDVEPATRVLEEVIQCSDARQLEKIRCRYFEDIEKVAVHPLGNFALQKLLTAWTDKETFSSLSAGVIGCLKQTFEAGHPHVVTALCSAAQRLGAQQNAVAEGLMTALDCHTPPERQTLLPSLILFNMNHEAFTTRQPDADLPVSLHGSLVLQHLLRFSKPILFVRGLLELSPSDLAGLMCDPRASHVFTVFGSSQSVGEKSRLALLDRVKDQAVTLACSKHGSHILEQMFFAAPHALRCYVADLLYRDMRVLKDSQFGTIVSSNMQLRLFGKEEWDQFITKKSKKRKQLDNLKQILDIPASKRAKLDQE